MVMGCDVSPGLDQELVEWLLEKDPELLNAEAIGGLFKPDGDAYLGGYPLLFAVSCDQMQMVQKLLEAKREYGDELKASTPPRRCRFLRKNRRRKGG